MGPFIKGTIYGNILAIQFGNKGITQGGANVPLRLPRLTHITGVITKVTTSSSYDDFLSITDVLRSISSFYIQFVSKHLNIVYNTIQTFSCICYYATLTSLGKASNIPCSSYLLVCYQQCGLCRLWESFVAINGDYWSYCR